MKSIILSVAILFCGFISTAQSDQREKIEAQRVAFITSELELTPSESEKFWPIYNQYEENKKEDHDFRDRKDKNMTEAQAEEMIAQVISHRESEIENTKKLVQDLQGVIPPTKILKLFRADKKFKRKLLGEIAKRRGGAERGRRKNSEGDN